MEAQYEELEAEVEADVVEIGERWDAVAAASTWMTIGLERSDVVVTQIVLAWVPTERLELSLTAT